MLERVQPGLLDSARHNVLIPNPEWFHRDWHRWLPRFDRVLVKTHHAREIFNRLGCDTRYVGFCSPDRRLPGVARLPQFLHQPGRSDNKGTQALLRLWQAHPQWPPLTVLWRSRKAELDPVPANVAWRRERVDDDALRQLQNAHAFHLCPSETEGYGHYIGEAMSVGAVVVTVDAPPMNEIPPGHALFCAATPLGTQSLATLYGFNADAMAGLIERCIAMDAAERDAIGAMARARYEDHQARFPVRLRDALSELG